LQNSDEVTPYGDVVYRWGIYISHIRPIYGYMWETVQDRVIITMERQKEIICALSNHDISDDLE